MSKTVGEIAEEHGFSEYSFSEVFEIKDSEKEAVEKLSKRGIYNDIDELREKLEYAGKRCTLYAGLIDFLEEGINKAKQEIIQNVR